MTNISVEIDEKNPTQIALSNMEKGMTQVFRDYMKNVETELLVKEIQNELAEVSSLVTGQRYWTGTLQSSIKFLRNSLKENPGQLEMKVGVDPSVSAKGGRTVAGYAIPVEMGLGHMPVAYKYTESGYLRWKQGLGQRIAAVLSAALRTPWGFRSVATGRFTAAPK